MMIEALILFFIFVMSLFVFLQSIARLRRKKRKSHRRSFNIRHFS